MNFKTIRRLLTYLFLIIETAAWSQKYNLLPDTIGLCFGDSASIEIKHPFNSNASIRWITPAGTYHATKKIQASLPGKYYIRISSSEYVNPLVDSSFVRHFAKPFLKLRDTALCRGAVITLDAKNPGMRYLWSNGKTTPKIKIENPGRYWVKVINGKCSLTDTLQVKLLPGSGSVVNPETTFCLNDEVKMISVKVNPNVNILWNTGATTPGIIIHKEGTYWVKTESEDCGVEVDTIRVRMKACECEMFIPNSFTPNEDDRNDLFYPVVQCEYSYFSIIISDRWGNTVYTSNNPSSKWDGRYKGNPCPEDNYDYRIESTVKGTDKKQVRNGRIALFR